MSGLIFRFTLASTNGVPEADYYLGLCYVNGAGVVKNETTGFVNTK